MCLPISFLKEAFAGLKIFPDKLDITIEKKTYKYMNEENLGSSHQNRCFDVRKLIKSNRAFIDVSLVVVFKVTIDAKTYFNNDVSVTKRQNIDKLAKAGTAVDKTE